MTLLPESHVLKTPFTDATCTATIDTKAVSAQPRLAPGRDNVE